MHHFWRHMLPVTISKKIIRKKLNIRESFFKNATNRGHFKLISNHLLESSSRCRPFLEKKSWNKATLHSSHNVEILVLGLGFRRETLISLQNNDSRFNTVRNWSRLLIMIIRFSSFLFLRKNKLYKRAYVTHLHEHTHVPTTQNFYT